MPEVAPEAEPITFKNNMKSLHTIINGNTSDSNNNLTYFIYLSNILQDANFDPPSTNFLDEFIGSPNVILSYSIDGVDQSPVDLAKDTDNHKLALTISEDYNDNKPHTMIINLSITADISNTEITETIHDDQSIAITVYIIPKNVMIDEAGTDSNKKLLMFRKNDITINDVKLKDQGNAVSTTLGIADESISVNGVDYYYLELPTGWNGGFEEIEDFWKIYDDYYLQLGGDDGSTHYLYIWVYRRLPNIFASKSKEEIFGEYLVSSASTSDNPTYPTNSLKWTALIDSSNTGPKYVANNRYGYVEWVIDNSKIDSLFDKRDGTFAITTDTEIEGIGYTVRFHRWDNGLQDASGSYDYTINSGDETFDINLRVRYYEAASQVFNVFRDQIELGDTIVVKVDDEVIDNVVSPNGSISTNDSRMLNKTSTIIVNRASGYTEAELYIYKTEEENYILRTDGVDTIDIDIGEHLYDSDTTIQLLGKKILFENQIKVNNLLIDGNSISANGIELTNNTFTVKSDNILKLDRTKDKHTRDFYVRYTFKDEAKRSQTKIINISILLCNDYVVTDAYEMKFFKSFEHQLLDWGETDYTTSTTGIDDGYFVNVKEDIISGDKQNSVEKSKGVDGNNLSLTPLNTAELYNFINKPTDRRLTKTAEPAAYPEGKEFKGVLYRFDGNRFLYKITFTVEVVGFCFKKLPNIIMKHGKEDVLNSLVDVCEEYQPGTYTLVDNSNNSSEIVDDKFKILKTIPVTNTADYYHEMSYNISYTQGEGDDAVILTLFLQTFKVYVYGDIDYLEEKELDLCASVDTRDMLEDDDTNIPIFKAYETNEIGGSQLTLSYDKALFFNTSVSTDETITVTVTPVGLIKPYQDTYTITYSYSVTENSENSPFQSHWEMDRNKILHTTEEDGYEQLVKNYLNDILNGKPINIAEDENDYLTSSSFNTATTFTVILETNCTNCEDEDEDTADDKCFTTREIVVYKYKPNKTLVLCNKDTFDSDLKSPIESYYKSELTTTEPINGSTLRSDITGEGEINDDDWLVVKNKVEPNSSTVGVWDDSTSSVDHLWKTTSITFKSTDSYESTITYNITLISNITQCKVVKLGKHNIMNKLPDVIGLFLKNSSNTTGLKISDDDIAVHTDDIYDLDSDTFTNVNNNEYDGSQGDTQDIKTLLTLDDNKTTTAFSLKPDTNIDYTYHLHHGGKTVELIYKVTVLINRLAKYIKLPQVTIGKPYSYEFTSEVLAEGTSICNIFCLPKGLTWDGVSTISGTIECAKTTETCTGENAKKKCYDCPVKITLEIAAPESDKEVGSCECIGQSSTCNDNCTFFVDGGVNCTNYDTQDYFLFIKNPKNDEVKPELKQLDNSGDTVVIGGTWDNEELNQDSESAEGQVSDTPEINGTLDNGTLTIPVSAGDETLNLNDYITDAGKEIRFVSGTLINDDGTLALPEENDGGDTDQIVISAQYKNRNCEYVEFGKIVVNVEHEPITSTIKKSQLSTGIQEVLANNPRILSRAMGGAFFDIFDDGKVNQSRGIDDDGNVVDDPFASTTG